MNLSPIGTYETLGRIDVLDFQELHSPTTIDNIYIKLKDATRVVRDRVRRRASDARLWGSLDALETRAAEQIARGFNLITNGVGVKCQTFEKVYGRGDPDKEIRAMEDYHEWGHRCKSEGVNINAVLNVLIEGRSCTEIDRELRQRRGNAKVNLLEALAIYINIKRWNKEYQRIK